MGCVSFGSYKDTKNLVSHIIYVSLHSGFSGSVFYNSFNVCFVLGLWIGLTPFQFLIELVSFGVWLMCEGRPSFLVWLEDRRVRVG